MMQQSAELWRLRAQQTRNLVQLMTSPVTRENLQSVANQYDIMARQIEERIAHGRVTQAVLKARQHGTP